MTCPKLNDSLLFHSAKYVIVSLTILFSTLRDRVPGRINSFLGALKMIITIIRHPNWIFVLIRINKGKKPATKMCRQHLIWDGKKVPMSPWQCYGHQSEFSWPNFAINSSSLPIPLHYQSQFGNSNPLLTTESFQPTCIKRGLGELSLQRIPVQNNAMQPRCLYHSHFNPKQKAPSEGYPIYTRADQSWKQSLWTTAGAAEAPRTLLHKPSEHIVD